MKRMDGRYMSARLATKNRSSCLGKSNAPNQELPSALAELRFVRPMKTIRFTLRVASGLFLLTALGPAAVHSEAPTPAPFPQPSIDGTYELTERVMANGTVVRPPAIAALYTMVDGRFSLNLFVN